MGNRITSRLDEKEYMLDLAIYNLNREIAQMGEQDRNTLFYGHACKHDVNRLRHLCSILTLLQDEQILVALGGECLPIEDLECFISKHVVLFEEGARVDLEKDTSGLQLWIALNPDSVSLQKWEEAACNVACEYDLVLNTDIVSCNYSLESKGDKLDCEVIHEFTAVHKSCAITINALSFKEQCALEFDTIVCDKACEIGFEVYRKANGCTLDLEQYVCLRNCDLDQKIIRTVLAAGCTINVGEL